MTAIKTVIITGSTRGIGRVLAMYGASKYSIRYLTRALIREAKGTPVLVGAICLRSSLHGPRPRASSPAARR